MDQDQLKKINEGKLLDVIRIKTAMYTGSRTLTAVSHFLDGYSFFLWVHGIQEERPLPFDFHDWVAYRLHFGHSTMGYTKMILERVPDDHAALDRFFELFDEYRTRKPNIVAVLDGTEGFEHTKTTIRDGVQSDAVVRIPGPQTLVTYTDDPGFFVRGFDPTLPFPRNGYFYRTMPSSFREKARILDPATYNRLLSESGEARKTRERIKAGEVNRL